MLLTFTVSPLSPHATSLSVHEFQRLLTRQLSPLSPLTPDCVRDKHRHEGVLHVWFINVQQKSYKLFFNGSEVGRLHRIGKLDPFASVRALPTGIKCGRHEGSVTDTRAHTHTFL